MITTVDKDEVSLTLWVHGQRARRSRPFRVNMPTDWHDADLMEELRDSRDIVEGWEIPGPHEQ